MKNNTVIDLDTDKLIHPNKIGQGLLQLLEFGIA
jgi:hypothetical protein